MRLRRRRDGLEQLQQAGGMEGHRHQHHHPVEGAPLHAVAAAQSSADAGGQTGQQKLHANLMQDVMRTLLASLQGG